MDLASLHGTPVESRLSELKRRKSIESRIYMTKSGNAKIFN